MYKVRHPKYKLVKKPTNNSYILLINPNTKYVLVLIIFGKLLFYFWCSSAKLRCPT